MVDHSYIVSQPGVHCGWANMVDIFTAWFAHYYANNCAFERMTTNGTAAEGQLRSSPLIPT